MKAEKMGVRDEVGVVMGNKTYKDWSRDRCEKMRVRANVRVRQFRDGKLIHEEVGENLVTDAGDEHLARRLVQGDTETAIAGMKLGTDNTAAAKNTSGHHIGTYISGSYEALDATPTLSDKGAGSGYRAQHVCTWVAGDVTNSGIDEVILTQDATDAAGAAGDTVARYVFGSTIDKQSGDSLEVTWNIDFLGA